MKQLVIAVLLVFVPSMAFADALDTALCVIEKSQFEALLKEAGAVEKIPDAKLFAAAAWHDFLGLNRTQRRFDHAGVKYELLYSRRDNALIYALSILAPEPPADTAKATPAQPPRLLCVGAIPKGEPVKKVWQDDAFVVVLRVGNFKSQ